MRRRPERILLFRSGRHLATALKALQQTSPQCDVTVVATPPALPALDDVGIPADRRIVYDRTPFFEAFAFIRSPAGRRVRACRFDRVCVLWQNQDGSGSGNVDRTAMLVSPRGFTAITPDGGLHDRRTLPWLARELTRAMASAALGLLLAACVYLPARALRPFRAVGR